MKILNIIPEEECAYGPRGFEYWASAHKDCFLFL